MGKNDISIVDVDDFLLSNAIDKKSIYPIGLPDVRRSYILSEAKSAGWKIFSESFVRPVLKQGFFSKPATYSVTEIPIVVDMKISSCRAFAGDGDYVLIGVGQNSLLAGKEHFQETGSRFSCFIKWDADYHNLNAANSGNILSWSTACPAQEDISWGSIGSAVAGIPGATLIEKKITSKERPKHKSKKKVPTSPKNDSISKDKVSLDTPTSLENYPGCGKSVITEGEELFPWQGSLYAVHMETKEEKFISPVALLSVTSSQYPNYPTIIVSSGGVIDPYKFDLVLDEVKVLGDNEVRAKDFKEMGFEVEVRFPKSKDMETSVTILKVSSIVQHPYYAETECFIEPCGPTRYNAKNDISVIHVDTEPLSTMDHLLPACLPEPSQSYLLQYATQAGTSVKAFRQPAAKQGLFKTLESYTWAKSPTVSHFEVESCAVVTGRAMGGFFTISNGTLCLDAANNRVSWGDLVMAPNSSGELALIGIGQHSAKDYIRSRQETATRLSCYLSWVASQYGMEGTSSEFQATWSTGCPQDADIRVGAREQSRRVI